MTCFACSAQRRFTQTNLAEPARVALAILAIISATDDPPAMLLSWMDSLCPAHSAVFIRLFDAARSELTGATDPSN